MGKTQKGKVLNIVVLICIVIIFLIFLLTRVFIKDTFQYSTIINGIDCSFLNIKDAEKKLEKTMNSATITMLFAEDKKYTCLGAYFDISIDNPNSLRGILSEQKDTGKNEYTMTDLYKVNEEKAKKYLASLSVFANNNSNKEPINAYLEWDSEQQEYYIVKETYGNKLTIETAYNYLLNSLRNGKTVIDFREVTDITPDITANSLELKKQMENINSVLDTTIEYELHNGETYTLDAKTMKDWVSRNDKGEYSIDIENNVTKFVDKLAKKAKYELTSTKFNATGLGTISIPFGRATYATVNTEEEIERLTKQLESKESTKLEVIYNDLPDYLNINTYIELDLSRQNVWMYVNGECVVDSPCVTGNVATGYATPAGIYYLTYKEMNTTLEGYNADGSTYSSPVTYWMPFNGGIGFHDASWRYSFGGNIYMTNGSHGCVNLPYWAASTIYSYINTSIPIIIY